MWYEGGKTYLITLVRVAVYIVRASGAPKPLVDRLSVKIRLKVPAWTAQPVLPNRLMSSRVGPAEPTCNLIRFFEIITKRSINGYGFSTRQDEQKNIFASFPTAVTQRRPVKSG